MSSALLLDTHAWVWSAFEPERLSTAATAALAATDTVLVSPVSFYEITQKVRIGKWPDLAVRPADLLPRALDQGVGVAALSAEICVSAGLADWPHRDPFDRLIAATALSFGAPLVTCDQAFADLPGLTCIW